MCAKSLDQLPADFFPLYDRFFFSESVPFSPENYICKMPYFLINVFGISQLKDLLIPKLLLSSLFSDPLLLPVNVLLVQINGAYHSNRKQTNRDGKSIRDLKEWWLQSSGGLTSGWA